MALFEENATNPTSKSSSTAVNNHPVCVVLEAFSNATIAQATIGKLRAFMEEAGKVMGVTAEIAPMPAAWL